MPKKGGKGGKGKKKAAAKVEGPPVPEYGPMGCDGTIDATKGGTITATRLGRTYSLVVPPGAVDASVSVSMRVTQFEGGEPGNFGLEGRIVSNRVEISPPLLDLMIPAILSIPHFCADEDGTDEMFVAWEGQHSSHLPGEDGVPASDGAPEEAVFRRLPGGTFNVGMGFSKVAVTQLGVFYVCSPHMTGLDYAVTKYHIPAVVRGGNLNAVAFDWVQGEMHLWSRTALDRPVGMDGPVYIKRRSRLKVDLEPQWDSSSGGASGDATYEETFIIPGTNSNLLTGKTTEGGSDAGPQQGAFEALQYEVVVVPTHSSEILMEAQGRLDRAVAELRMAEDEALSIKKQLDTEDKMPYMVRINEQKMALRELEDRYLPWSDKRDKPTAARPSGVVPKESRISVGEAEPAPPTPKGEKRTASATASATPSKDAPPAEDPPAEAVEGPGGEKKEEEVEKKGGAAAAANAQRQAFSDLPLWMGKDMQMRFGARVIPSSDFQATRLLSQLSLVLAEKDVEERRILEIPETSGVPGGRARKVWVGPPKQKLYSFTPISTRASYAELVVNVRLGAWTQRCIITLPNDTLCLDEVRPIVQSHCFGVDLSEARFVRSSGQSIIDVRDEDKVRASSLRPSAGLWGNARRPGEYTKKLVFSYPEEMKEIVETIATSLRARGFPLKVDASGSASASFDQAALLVVFLAPSYNHSPALKAEYLASQASEVPRVHVFGWHFHAEGWLKQTIKEQQFGEDHRNYHQIDLPASSPNLSTQQLDDIAMGLGKVVPVAPAPVIFKMRQAAPTSMHPPISAAEFLRLNPIIINTATLALELAAKKKPKGKK